MDVNNTSMVWDELQSCSPALESSVELGHRLIRGDSWLVLHNSFSGEYLRLNAAAQRLVESLDGSTTLSSLCSDARDDPFDPVDVCRLVSQLQAAGMIRIDDELAANRLVVQQHQGARRISMSRWTNPLALRLPLHNPDWWVGKLTVHLSWLFTRKCMWALTLLLVAALAAGLYHIDGIVEHASRVTQSPRHWWFYGLCFPVLKLLHETAHAICIKRWGGSVNEAGITFLVLMPVPYVDATDAWSFPERGKRLLVSAAGMLAELAVAATALLVWINVSPGLASDLAFALFTLGTVTTVLFNANPLLKFDGYYLLADWLDMPNLSSRSLAYYRFLARRTLFRVQDIHSPATAAGERRWLLAYGALSTLYRIFITCVIAIFLINTLFVLGVLLSCVSVYHLLLKPASVLFHYLRSSAELHGKRRRAVSLVVSAWLCTVAMLVLLPLPSSTRTTGVVWVPEQSRVFALQEGEIHHMHTSSGQQVRQGQLLFSLDNPVLDKDLKVATAALASRTVDYKSLLVADPAEAQTLLAELQSLRSTVSDLEKRVERLQIHAPVNGRFTTAHADTLIGRLVKQGELIAYVINQDELIVRAVLAQGQMGRVQDGVNASHVRLAERFEESLEAVLTRQTPAANNRLPSPSLAYNGRSGIAVASSKDDQLTTIERVFHIELELPGQVPVSGIGERAYVTLEHAPESLGRRWWRSTRQLLLRRITV